MSEPSELPSAPRQRDPSARDLFEILVREHADMVTAYLRSLLGRSSAVDDIFQRVMLTAWRRLDDYDRSRPFGPWLRGIAHRLVLEHYRTSKSAPACMDPAVIGELDRRFERLGSAPGDTFREKADRLQDCVSKLPDAMREAIEHVYARGMLFNAAALALGSGEEALKKRVQRARALLAECLDSSLTSPRSALSPALNSPDLSPRHS